MDSISFQNKIKKVIHLQDPKAKAILFGSRARGDSKINSDEDLLILIDESKVTNEIEDKFRSGLYDLELESGQIISTFIYPKEYWKNQLAFTPLYHSVSEEGITL